MPVRTVWTLALNNQLTFAPAFDAERAYFSIEHDRLVAYELLDGAQCWITDARPVVDPAVGNELVFVAEAESLVALHAADGSVAWRVDLAEPLAMRPVFDNGWLVGATADGVVLAFRAADGHLVWKQALGAPAHAPPALAADRVYLSATNGRVVSLRVETGEPVWERRVGGSPNEILALDDRLYVGSTDNFLYCLMTKDGRIDWRWRTGADIVAAPIADERAVYFVSYDNVLRALDRTSGGQKWMQALPLRPTAAPAIAGSTLLVGGQSPTIRTYNVKDGAPTTEINAGAEVGAPPHVLSQPVTGLPMVLVVTRDIAKGATATLSVRSIDPIPTPVGPLGNPVMPGPTPPIRP